jgi:hypothetical protein
VTGPRANISVSGDSENGYRSYYGRAVLKEPVWTSEIPWYFFTGGLAGASSTLSAFARLAGNDGLARRALLVAFGGATVSPVLLISDLGRPERFYNMLRVFKPTSPMSVGTWILSAFGAASGIATIADVLGIFLRLGRAAEAFAALLGPALSTYTAVLLADTSVPVWHEARHELPLVFAGGSAASAGAAAIILTPVDGAAPARRLLLGGAAVEVAASEAMKRRLGELAEPYDKEEAGRYEKLALALTFAGAAITSRAGRKKRGLAVLGGALTLGGAAAKRWSIFRAGFQSARDPKYTVKYQRERLARRPPGQRRTETLGANGHAT